MARLLPPLNALKAFEAAGRHESFSRAAEEMNVSHSAISRHVRGLEDNLGASLFRDLPRGVELTLEGRALLTRVTAALDEMAAATEMARQQPQGVITVSCEPLFAQKFLIPRLSGFYAAYPEIDLRIEASRALADVTRHEADLAIRFAHKGSLSVPSDLLSDAPIYPYAAPTLCPDGWHDPAQLQGHRLYRDRSGDLWPRWAALAGTTLPEGHAEAWRLETGLALEATLHGQGVFLGSQECVLDELRAGRLIRCFSIGLRDGCFRLVQGAGSARRKSVRVFRSWLLDETAPMRGTGIDGDDQPFG